jgi:hypothetical protein
VNGEYDDKGPLMHIGFDNHPLFDGLLWLKAKSNLWWLQMTGFDDRKHLSSKQFEKLFLREDNFRNCVKGIRKANNSNTSDITHSIVLVVARKLTEKEERTFKTMVGTVLAEHYVEEGACKIGDVIVVDDMCDFIPPLAHKFMFHKPINAVEGYLGGIRI